MQQQERSASEYSADMSEDKENNCKYDSSFNNDGSQLANLA